MLNVSTRSVADAKTVLKRGDAEPIDAIRHGRNILRLAGFGSRETDRQAKTVNVTSITAGEYAENEVRKDFAVS